MSTAEGIVADVLDRWKAPIEARRPDQVAALFAEDAIFQGLRSYGVGRQGIVQTRQPARGVVLGYVEVDFAFTDQTSIPMLLSVPLTEADGRWLISHYQVSQAPASH